LFLARPLAILCHLQATTERGMAPRLSGFTRASALGPISEFMERQGGSVLRVLQDVDLPFALLEERDLLIPLREQFRFLERAARETGDNYFGARLGQVVRTKELSAFGAWVCAAETLMQAIERGHAALNTMLQTSTVLTLERHGPKIRWWIEFVEPETDGRHHNEMLGVGYMIDTVRVYAGKAWTPDIVFTAYPRGTPRGPLEEILGADVSHGHPVPGLEFDARLLCASRWERRGATASCWAEPEPRVPAQDDMLATIAAVTDLAVLEGYPRMEWVAEKLGTSRRSLQRRLASHGATFNRVAEQSLLRRAKTLLAGRNASITDIAFTLGYGDPAHFTRAFRRWTGITPSAYRIAAS
jgi:AraC-like DNA-binding protein